MANGSHCVHFVERKKRFCRMTVREGRRYCGEHQRDVAGSDVENERVPCPLDPSHTCYRSKLTRHLSVCNVKRRLDARPAFVVEGANLDDETIAAPPRVPLSQLDESVVETVIRKIHAAHDKLPEFSRTILRHDALEDKLSDETCGSNVRKHLLQNASLLGHLEQAGLVRDDTCFIEFGAGKARLTYWLGQIVKNKSNSCILLVDRSSHRHKNDNKLKREESHLVIKRIRADIADLQLNQVAEVQPMKYKVGIAKHLCGTATDLTIRCLMKSMNSEPKVDIRGLIVAFCCHHKCEYSSYVGREYLRQCGFTADEFPVLCSIVSWATCGYRLKSDVNSPRDSTAQQIASQFSVSNEREAIGRKAKTLLNWGRLVFLESVGFQAELLYYTSTDVSLENMCIVATREEHEREEYLKNPYFKEHEYGDFTPFYVTVAFCAVLGGFLFILNIVFCWCSRHREYWQNRHSGNRWIQPLWTVLPHKTPPLDLSELEPGRIKYPQVRHEIVRYHDPESQSATPQPQEYMEMHKRESEI